MTATTWAKKLFAPTTGRTARRPAPAGKTRLGLQTLDDRLVPSAVASLAPDHTLTVTADDSGHTVDAYVWHGQLKVMDQNDNTCVFAGDASGVGKIVYHGTSTPNVAAGFRNDTALPGDYSPGANGGSVYGGGGTNTFHGGTGPATCYGGSGSNTFFDTANSLNDFEAGRGDNLLYRSHDGAYLFTDWAGGSVGSVQTVGLQVNPYQHPGNLNAPGLAGITAYLDGTGHTLTLAGPTGGGFQLDGTWTDTRTPAGNGQFTHSFRSSTAVQLETGIVTSGHHLAVPLPGGSAVTVTTSANRLDAPVGQYSGLTMAGGLPLTKDTDTGGSAFTDLLAKANLSVDAGGASWGIKLGSDLSNLSLPLLADVPYLYASYGSGQSVSFGDHLSAGTDSFGGAVVFDPADPALYVKAQTSLGDFAGAVSLHSAIPYTPLRTAPGATPPSIYGNLYLSGAGIALGELPVAVSGSVVLSLDAQHDGKLLAALKQSGTALHDLMAGTRGHEAGLTALRNLGTTAADEIAIGVNGGVALTTTQYGISLSADVATGSAYYSPLGHGDRTVGFDVGTVNPFAGTVLERFAPSTTVDVGGWLTVHKSGRKDWGFTASTSAASLGGFAGSSLLIEAGSATGTAHAHMNINGLMGAANFDLDGTVSLSTGDFDLKQTASFSLDAKIATMSLSESFELKYQHGVFEAHAHLHGDASAGIIGVYVDADLDLTVDHGTVHVSGSGTAGGHVGDISGSVGVAFSDHGFGFDICGKTVGVKW